MPVDGFEEITKKITEEEIDMIPYFEEIFSKLKQKEYIKRKEVCEKLFSLYNVVITGPRFRTIIHHIRRNHIIHCLLANKHGYFISYDPDDIMTFIRSNHQRANSFLDTAEALTFQLNEQEEEL